MAADATENIDTLISARWILPVEPAGTVLENHAIAVTGGCIQAILPLPDAERRFTPAQRVTLDDHVIIPGLINLHTHAAMVLLRGFGDDLPLMTWLETRIWPAETRLVSPEFVFDGTLIACAEMLRGGVTCFNDMYFFPEAAARAIVAAGMRAALGLIVIDFPSPYAADGQDYLSKGLATRDALHGESLLSFCIAPHAPYTVSDKLFEKIVTYSGELDLPIHTHVHETADELEASVKNYGLRPLARLQQLGALGPNLLAVHATHLNDSEIDLLAQHGCHVAHCPASNLKLAGGIAPLQRLVAAGVNVGIGTDGAASNNRLDVLGETRLAALLAKGTAADATAVPAHTALAMATINAARALGIDGRTGSLVPGKRADITAIDFSAPELSPCYDPVSHVIYAAGREHVSHVWVDGELLLEQGRLTHIDNAELARKAAYWRERITGSTIQD
ncbi:MAG TPA: TRZ/ATZ family hydrolase [Burkholderiales bacterium]|nr:TRZ/ATZ family hydrolase [Burkholderiales bacterium]